MNDTVKLDRALGLWSVVLFGLAYMTPMIVFGTFGALAAASQGTTAMAYLVAAAAILLTAISYGVMARVYPVAGSAYTYARRSINPSVGFLVGWAVLLDYFFLPMVIWLIGAAYLTSAFPAIPAWVWIVGFIAVTTHRQRRRHRLCQPRQLHPDAGAARRARRLRVAGRPLCRWR